jgi:hypothetical protein
MYVQGEYRFVTRCDEIGNDLYITMGVVSI